MNKDEIEKLTQELYRKRLNGVEFSQIRLELESKGLAEEDIKQLIALVNEQELDNLKVNTSTINPNFFLVLALITAFSAFALAYFINRIVGNGSYQLLNAIPLAGSAILFYNYYQNKKKYKP